MEHPVLVTGNAGFIGSHLTRRLLQQGHQVVGVDNLNDYYSPQLKRDRLAQLPSEGRVQLELDIADTAAMAELFNQYSFQRVFHLAAQPGVRYSLINPHAYVASNVQGFLNILEGCRHHQVPHLIYASSSSVYGLNTTMPFSTHRSAAHPVSFYGATKKANEMMAHSYASMFGLPVTGLRFFTVYGPWDRPDMALQQFTRAILRGEPIKVFNQGEMQRDFTFVADIVEGLVRLADHIPAPDPNWDATHPDPATSSAPYRLYNIGNHQPVKLSYFIDLIEQRLGVKAIREYLPMQTGDVVATYADIDDLQRAVGFSPATPIEEGVARAIDWYVGYRPTNPDF